jgi:hypothetical protein
MAEIVVHLAQSVHCVRILPSVVGHEVCDLAEGQSLRFLHENDIVGRLKQASGVRRFLFASIGAAFHFAFRGAAGRILGVPFAIGFAFSWAG